MNYTLKLVEVTTATENLFSLPVAFIFQNESALEEGTDLGYNATPTSSVDVVSQTTSHGWKKEEVAVIKPEKIGETIRRELKWAFILHAYGFGCLFFILAFYTFFSLLNLRSFISSRPFMSTINGFLCLLGTSRAASLFIDPYNLKENMPKLFGQVLWDLGFPSIISAFSLVQLAFLQFTQLQVGLQGMRRKSCLSLIVTAHFLSTIGMDIVVASHENFTVAKHVVHYIFLTWGVFLCSNFLYTGYKVMSMIRNIPGGFKTRELPDPNYKGIMQLAILQSHNNLVGSMTAALLPTLCTSKIHQQDNTSLSAVGFRSDGNSRILESESIPMLEEMAGSSGDEINPKPLIRGSSFQNQTRNSHKFNLKPKLSLRSVPDELRDDEWPPPRQPPRSPRSPKSPKTSKTSSPKTPGGKPNEFDFNVKPILKRTESFVTTKSVHEFKNKLQQRTCFENENFRFGNERKSKRSCGGEGETVVPEILVSGPGNSDPGRRKEEGNKTKLNKIIKEISEDLDEMRILREEKVTKTEEIVEVHERKPETERSNKPEGGGSFCECKRGSQVCRKEHRKHRKGGESFRAEPSSDAAKPSPEITVLEDVRQKHRGKRNGKSLSWKKTTSTEKEEAEEEEEEEEEEKATSQCLLQETATDATLRSVLNHIRRVNRGGGSGNNEDDLEKVRKSKVEWVLNITYITAMWGLMLCLSNMGKIYSPLGVPKPRKLAPSLNATYSRDLGHGGGSNDNRELLFSSWPWLWFQTFCRALELAMGCAMANITRQPAANHRFSRAAGFRHRDSFFNI